MKIIIVLLLFMPCQILAQNAFEELFDVNPGNTKLLADQVTLYHAENIDSSFAEQNQQLNSISQQLDQLLQQQPKNPLLWFLQGLNYNNLASLYFNTDILRSQQYTAKKLSAYEQAMKLDKTQQPHLSAAIYSTMKHALPMDKKITAIQKELSLGGNGENESYYWYLHWSNIHSLTQAGRLDEAQQATQKMQRELEASGHSNDNYQQILKQVKAEVEQAQLSKPANPVTEIAEQKSNREKPKQNVLSMNKILWLVLIMLVIVLTIGLIYEKRARKK
ncbi:MAG: hypothetical protein ACN4GM_01920 [Gammaproteobacteria bacterium]